MPDFFHLHDGPTVRSMIEQILQRLDRIERKIDMQGITDVQNAVAAQTTAAAALTQIVPQAQSESSTVQTDVDALISGGVDLTSTVTAITANTQAIESATSAAQAFIVAAQALDTAVKGATGAA